MSQLSSAARGLLIAGATAAVVALPAAAQSSRTPKYSNEFLSLGVGARALGMGKVQVSLATDATAGYWNPAGLVNQTHKYDGVLMHSELFSGIVKNDYAAFSMPLDDKSAVGVSLLRLGVDNIADTRALVNEYGYVDYSKIEYFSVADYALLLSYARKLGVEGLSVGGSGKLIYRNIGKFAHGYGFGIDAGVQYNHNGWNLGLMARDITTTFNAWSINGDEYVKGVLNSDQANLKDEVPKNSTEITLPRFVFGVGRRFELPKQFSALVAADFEATTDGQRGTPISTKAVSVNPSAGLELGYRNLVFLRGGVGNYQQISSVIDQRKQWKGQYSLGAGVAVSGLRVDLALSRLAVEKLGSTSQTNSLIVSLGYGFK